MPKVTTAELVIGKPYNIEYFTHKSTTYGEALCVILHHDQLRKIYFFPDGYKKTQHVLEEKLRIQSRIKPPPEQKFELIHTF